MRSMASGANRVQVPAGYEALGYVQTLDPAYFDCNYGATVQLLRSVIGLPLVFESLRAWHSVKKASCKLTLPCSSAGAEGCIEGPQGVQIISHCWS